MVSCLSSKRPVSREVKPGAMTEAWGTIPVAQEPVTLGGIAARFTIVGQTPDPLRHAEEMFQQRGGFTISRTGLVAMTAAAALAVSGGSPPSSALRTPSSVRLIVSSDLMMQPERIDARGVMVTDQSTASRLSTTPNRTRLERFDEWF